MNCSPIMSSDDKKETETSNECDEGFLPDANPTLESPRFSIAMKMNRHDKDKDTLLPRKSLLLKPSKSRGQLSKVSQFTCS